MKWTRVDVGLHSPRWIRALSDQGPVDKADKRFRLRWPSRRNLGVIEFPVLEDEASSKAVDRMLFAMRFQP